MSVLRRPLALSRFAASARFKKLGAAVTTPNEAKAMLPDLIKYRRFIILTLLVTQTSVCERVTHINRNLKIALLSLPLELRRTENQSRQLHQIGRAHV